jgi:four helix bundle protein
MSVTNFIDSDLWKRAARLSVDLYRSTADLDDTGLHAPLTNSSLTIAGNIAKALDEGLHQDSQGFLTSAIAACAELRSQLYIGVASGYLRAETGDAWLTEAREIAAMLVDLRDSPTTVSRTSKTTRV